MARRLVLAALLVSGLATPVLAGEATEAAAAENSLEAMTVRLAGVRLNVEVEKQEPERVLDLIRDAAKVNIVVGPDARAQLEGRAVSLKLKNVTALSALQQMLRQLGMVTTYGDEALIVATAESAAPQPQITVYDIRDLTERRGERLPPTVFGSQVDMLYYYWIRTQLGPRAGTDGNRDPFWEFDLVNRYPPDHIGEVIAKTVQEKFGKDTGVSVTYHDGYLVVVEKPKPTRVPVMPPQAVPAATSISTK